MMFVTIDSVRKDSMSKTYCKCGNIVSLDRNVVKLKRSLKKNIECPICRNFRISNEIEHINGLYDGTLDDETMV